jgi:hypothetical protein
MDQMDRERYVIMSTEGFVAGLREEITVEYMEAFVAVVEKRVREGSRIITEHCLKNELALTHHAAHIRVVIEKLRALREDLIPSLKKRMDFGKHLVAVRYMGFICAECETMENLIL